MGSGGFLTSEERRVLTELARDGLVEHRLARRANALVLLDRGMSWQDVAGVLLVHVDTIRQWRTIFADTGAAGLGDFHYQGSQSFLSAGQEAELQAWVSATLPRTTREVGSYIEARFGITYESRSGLIVLLHRLGFVHRKPREVPGKMDPVKQASFIKFYESLLNRLSADEMVLFMDAMHPTHGAQPVGCWAPKDVAIAVEQTTGREHVNIVGAIDLETGATCIAAVDRVDAESTIAFFEKIEARFPTKRVIHLFADNARCHHAGRVRAWLSRPGCRIVLHFIPPYCPHLNPAERLWGVTHKALIHNRCHANVRAFGRALLIFLRREVPAKWHTLRDQITDNFRIRNPAEFRILR